jgi:hypothetical protein
MIDDDDDDDDDVSASWTHVCPHTAQRNTATAAITTTVERTGRVGGNNPGPEQIHLAISPTPLLLSRQQLQQQRLQ